MLKETLDVVQPQADAKVVFINNELGDRLPSLNVDKSLFSMAVMNIIGNAVKYTPAGGTVTLSADYDEMSFKIAVRDTGIGIPEEYHDKIFDKFFRVVSASDGFHGSGVGLATAREIVRLHDGDITVTSTAGAGSTFVISLPRTRINSTVGD